MCCCTIELQPHTPEAKNLVPPSMDLSCTPMLPSFRKSSETCTDLILKSIPSLSTYFFPPRFRRTRALHFATEEDATKYSESLLARCGRPERTSNCSRQSLRSALCACSSESLRFGGKRKPFCGRWPNKVFPFVLLESPVASVCVPARRPVVFTLGWSSHLLPKVKDASAPQIATGSLPSCWSLQS